MKSIFLTLLINATMFNCFATDSTNLWSAGIRTGVGHNFANLKRITKENKGMRAITTRMQHHLFVNRSFGKKEQWMVEVNAGYSALAKEESYSSVNSEYMYYNFSRTHTFAVNTIARYTFYQSKSLNWKHYAGLFLNFDKSFMRSHSFEENGHHLHNTTKYVNQNYPTILNSGIEYFGKINLNHKISFQYLLSYSAKIGEVTPGIYVGNQPFTQRIGYNFGLGWAF